MLSPRLPLLSALLVLLPTGRCAAAALLRGSGSRSEGHVDAPGTSTDPPAVTEHGAKAPEKLSRSHHGMEGNHKDPQNKENFIKHLTGPLYFHPNCRKLFYRLYHNTRDCTIPAYYKRCARLLTRLASSPRCAER
ncbi:ALK and LTK ligand 2b [Channa argus]|uniref:ALK and LTK ligand 2b n=1 Tax=Channa argus TaxID=215402 RepID=UPI00352250B3